MGRVLALVLVSSLHGAIGESCDHWLLLNSYVKAAVTRGQLHHPIENRESGYSGVGMGSLRGHRTASVVLAIFCLLMYVLVTETV